MRKLHLSMIVVLAYSFVLCLLSACGGDEFQEYYSQKDNYVSVTGIVDYLAYNEDNSALYLEFTDLTYEFDDVCFKIVGDNLTIVKENGIDEKIKTGDKVTFTTAPRYFGDGYVMPIVEISVNGECLLEFENGYSNLLNWLS